MFCVSCGKRVSETDRYCSQCGKVPKILQEKYGSGTVFTERCARCGYEKELCSSGAHVSESGCIRVYSEDEEFTCPHCVLENEATGLPNTGLQNTALPEKESKEAGNQSRSASVVKSFNDYKALKGKNWKSLVSKTSAKHKEKDKEEEEDVGIFIGLIEWSDISLKLKPKRGKRLALRISNQASYHKILDKAKEKWANYNKDCYKDEQEYVLLFEDGQSAEFLPGTYEPFKLSRYREEVGKEYKRIVLYLCSNDDYKSEISAVKEDSDGDETQIEPLRKKCCLDDVDSKTENAPEKCLRDEQGEKALQGLSDSAILDSIDEEAENTIIYNKNENKTGFADLPSALKSLERQVDKDDQFFLVMRRKAPIMRCLKLWQREAGKTSPEKALRVHFSGEDGIDNGAMGKEFLEYALKEIRIVIFPDGAPVDSMYHIQNGVFRTCGQIVATSIVQGGPAFACFEECTYEMLVNPDVDVNHLSKEKHLTTKERKQLDELVENMDDCHDGIIDFGYTGLIDTNHKEDISATIMVSVVNKRLLYLKEFCEGLKCYGLADAMRANPDIFKSLFVTNASGEKPVDASYVFSLLKPFYSEPGTSKRTLEEEVIDSFQDFLMWLEDEKVVGYSEALAWNTDGSVYQDEEPTNDTDKFLCADLTPAGVLSWLTGQRHRPLNGDPLVITVHFDHECIVRNPIHRVCFPQVRACGQEITFPVAHMCTTEEFKEVFLIAYCKGQAFAKP